MTSKAGTGTGRQTSPSGWTVERFVEAGLVGGRTVQINERGEVECVTYPVRALSEGLVRIRTIASAISPGTEMTFVGTAASNVYLAKTWDPELRLFVPGVPTMRYPLVLGYRATGEVVESTQAEVPVGTRLFGNWRHTEYTVMNAENAPSHLLPEGLTFEDGVDIAQMGPICINAVASAEGEHIVFPAVVFGAGPIGLITAQVVRATGATHVYVVDRLPYRLGIAEGLGFTPLDASSIGDVAAHLKRELGPEAIPVAFECTGATAALHEAIRCVRQRGVVVALGFYQGEAKGLFLGEEFHHNGVHIRSGQIGNLHPTWTWETLRERTVELALSGQLVLGGLPRLRLPVERAADGFAALARPNEVLQVQLSYDRDEGESGAHAASA
jgi:NADPH:quinone reductase-like Zn-dependent oxidoreductase